LKNIFALDNIKETYSSVVYKQKDSISRGCDHSYQYTRGETNATK